MTAVTAKQASFATKLKSGSGILTTLMVVITIALIPAIIQGGLKLFLQRVFDSLNNGAVYAVTAIALVIIFKATTLINFAGANIAMFGAYICWWLNSSYGVPIWIAIFIAMVLDSLDGRVARMTNTQSEFGAEYDSLSDMVAFGAAPALVIYEWSLRGLGKWGWLAAFVYVAGAALRLARFNTNIEVVDKAYFQGLPSPAAAAMVAGFVWVMDDLRFGGADMTWLAWGITLYAGLSMVSNSPFYSFKTINLRKSVPFIVVFLIALAIVAVSSDPPKVLFAVFLAYGLAGHGLWLWRLWKKRGTARA